MKRVYDKPQQIVIDLEQEKGIADAGLHPGSGGVDDVTVREERDWGDGGMNAESVTDQRRNMWTMGW